MNRSKRIEQELSGFIELGGIMTLDLRRLAAETLFWFLYDPSYPALQRLDASAMPTRYPNWYRTLARLVEHEPLRTLTRNNEDLAFSVARETLTWCRRTAQLFEQEHPDREEEQLFTRVSADPAHIPLPLWEESLTQLKRRYRAQSQDWDFFLETLQAQEARMAQDPAPDTDMVQENRVLKQKIVEAWSGLLFQKKARHEETFLEERFGKYFRDLRRKVGQLQDLGDLLSPYYSFLGNTWSDAVTQWELLDWDLIEKHISFIRESHALRDLAQLLGRFRAMRFANDEKKRYKPAPRQMWSPSPYGKSEIVGIHYSDDIGNMLPTETALLSTPETEVLLDLKFVEKKILSFQYRALENTAFEVVEAPSNVRTAVDEAGPFIVCMDTSGSMYGDPERIAKALTFVLLEYALRQNRRVYLISFSNLIQTLELSGATADMVKMAEFLRMSFHGGTDIHPALREALTRLNETTWKQADVVIMSDFIIPRLDYAMYKEIQVQRSEKMTRFHSIYITRRPDTHHVPLPIFDNHWIYDLDNPDLMRQAVDHFIAFEAQLSIPGT